MNNKLIKAVCACAAVFAACICLVTIYKNLAFGLLNIPLNSVQSAALPVLGIILALVICLRFVLPKLGEKAEEEPTETRPDTIRRCTDCGAWLFLGLALASLVASPLASTADYIGYAVLFGSVFAVLALIPVISVAEKFAETLSGEKLAVGSAVAAFLLSFVPAVGISTSVSAVASATVSLREGAVARGRGITLLAVNLFSVLLSVAVTLFFILLII